MSTHTSPRILAFAGSTRSNSLNKKLVRAAADIAREEGAEVTVIDLKDFEMPLYDGDFERTHGLPEAAQRLRALFLEHDALMIASPEYNGSLSGVLKNSIDWISRKVPGEKTPLTCFRGKTALLMAAAPGGLGGIRALGHLNTILSGIEVMVLPGMVSVPQAKSVFDDAGALTDATLQQTIQQSTRRLIAVTRALPAQDKA